MLHTLPQGHWLIGVKDVVIKKRKDGKGEIVTVT